MSVTVHVTNLAYGYESAINRAIEELMSANNITYSASELLSY